MKFFGKSIGSDQRKQAVLLYVYKMQGEAKWLKDSLGNMLQETTNQ